MSTKMINEHEFPMVMTSDMNLELSKLGSYGDVC